MNTYAIDVHGLTKRFGQRTIVDNIDIRIKSGTIWAFWAPTAAAKPPPSACSAACSKPTADKGNASDTTSAAKPPPSAAKPAT